MAYVLAVSAVVLALAVRPAIAGPDSRWLDLFLLLYALAVAASIVRLPPNLRFALSPASRVIDLTLRLGEAPDAAVRPLSIDPSATRVALALMIAAVDRKSVV